MGDDHVLIVDSLGAPLHAKAFIAAIRREVPTKPFGRLVLTHHHGDHIEGNQYFAPPAEIVGHEYCREAMLAAPPPRQPKWEKREGWADGTEDHRILPPVTTLTDKLTYHYGNMVVELIANAPAHTWGDVMVYLPQSKVLFAGDLAFHYVAPFAFNGHVTKWLAAVDRIMKMDVDVIVPGHGPIGGKKELAEMGQYFEILKSEARKRFDAGITAGRAAAEIQMGRFEQWLGAPERMVMNVHRLYQEFSGTLTPEADFPGMQAAAVEYGKIKGVPPRLF